MMKSNSNNSPNKMEKSFTFLKSCCVGSPANFNDTIKERGINSHIEGDTASGLREFLRLVLYLHIFGEIFTDAADFSPEWGSREVDRG
jgi:hypothetical protein